MKDYLQKILALCTENQLSMFNRMYPNGPDKNQIKRAIQQVEQTLKVFNCKNQKLREENKESKQCIEILTTENNKLKKEINYLKEDLKESNIKITNLSTPSAIESANINASLQKLAALEAVGVDNWEYYDEAMNNIGE